jgi:ABC-type dipeptide/oligopeptide/nickel transport system permease component
VVIITPSLTFVVLGALLVGGTVLGIATGVTTGGRRRSKSDRALAIGSAFALSAPVYWFGFIVLTLFAPSAKPTSASSAASESHVPSLDVVQALVLEAALLIAVTMFLADLLRARIPPRAGART